MSRHVTFNVELNHKSRKDGRHNVQIRFTKERVNRRIKTEINVLKKDFNKNAKVGNWVRASEPRNWDYNNTLKNRIQKYETSYSALLDEGIYPSIDELLNSDSSTESKSFLEFYKQEIVRYQKIGKYRSSQKHQFIFNKLERYLLDVLKKDDLLFLELNVPFLTKYDIYLKDVLTNHQNTVHTDLKNIRTIYRNAIRQQVVEQHTYPFFQFQLHQVPTIKDKLSIEDIENLGQVKLTLGTLKSLSRDTFLFTYYASGMRWGDVCTLRWVNISDNWQLRYIMSKNNKVVDIELPQQAIDIIKQYKTKSSIDTDFIFPLLRNNKDYSEQMILKKAISSKNSVVDRELKKLAILAKIRTNLTFHLSRHSFAYHLYLQTKDVKVVQEALYHSSLAETQKYLKTLGATEIDAQLRKLFTKQMPKQIRNKS